MSSKGVGSSKPESSSSSSSSHPSSVPLINPKKRKAQIIIQKKINENDDESDSDSDDSYDSPSQSEDNSESESESDNISDHDDDESDKESVSSSDSSHSSSHSEIATPSPLPLPTNHTSPFSIRIVSPIVTIPLPSPPSLPQFFPSSSTSPSSPSPSPSPSPSSSSSSSSSLGSLHLTRARNIYKSLHDSKNKMEKIILRQIFGEEILNSNEDFEYFEKKSVVETNEMLSLSSSSPSLPPPIDQQGNLLSSFSIPLPAAVFNTKNKSLHHPMFQPLSGKNDTVTSYYIDTMEALMVTLEILKASKVLSVDCEGVNLGRTGELCLLQISPLPVTNHSSSSPSSSSSFSPLPTHYDVYLIDVVVLGPKCFDVGLRSLLEDPSSLKLLYDCRRDSESLFHQFHTKLENVCDIQLLQVAYRRQHNDEMALLPGLVNTINFHYSHDIHSDIQRLKESMSSRYSLTPHLWKMRPLLVDLQLYAGFDVALLHRLFRDIIRGSSSRLGLAENMADAVCVFSDNQWNSLFRDCPVDSSDKFSREQSRMAPNSTELLMVKRPKSQKGEERGIRRGAGVEEKEKEKEKDNDHSMAMDMDLPVNQKDVDTEKKSVPKSSKKSENSRIVNSKSNGKEKEKPISHPNKMNDNDDGEDSESDSESGPSLVSPKEQSNPPKKNQKSNNVQSSEPSNPLKKVKKSHEISVSSATVKREPHNGNGNANSSGKKKILL